MPVIPASRPVHEQAVHGVHRNTCDNLQNVCNGRRAGARKRICIPGVWKQASEARSVTFLNEDIPVITIGADCGENDRGSRGSEMPTRCQARRVVINAAYRDFTRKIHTEFNRFF
jgi:hypothetical protein